MFRAMRHADAFERFRDALLALGGVHTAISQREFNVLIDRQVADQVEALKDKTNFPVSNPCSF